MSILKPDAAVMASLATAAVVYSVYSNALPTVADLRVGQQGDADIAAAERGACWLAAGVVAGISLITQDYTVFTVGAGMIVGLSWLHRHANEVNPLTGVATRAGGEHSMYVATDDSGMATAA